MTAFQTTRTNATDGRRAYDRTTSCSAAGFLPEESTTTENLASRAEDFKRSHVNSEASGANGVSSQRLVWRSRPMRHARLELKHREVLSCGNSDRGGFLILYPIWTCTGTRRGWSGSRYQSRQARYRLDAGCLLILACPAFIYMIGYGSLIDNLVKWTPSKALPYCGATRIVVDFAASVILASCCLGVFTWVRQAESCVDI